jgi:hypothetical protein
MSPLNIHAEENANAPKKSKNKMLKIMLGIGALIMIPVIGTTLAAQVTINTGGPDNEVLFAQGKAATVACDATVVLKAKSVYSYGAYRLSEVTVSDIEDGDCGGENFIVGVADIDQGTYQQSEIGFFNYGTPLTAEATLTSASENCAADFTCAYNSGTGTLTITVGTGAGGGGTYWEYDSRTRSTDVGDILIQQANAG